MNNEEIKKLVADENLRIELHDQIASNLKKLFEEFEGEAFSGEQKYTPEEFKSRIKKCEELTKELCVIHALLGFWGTDEHFQLQTFVLENLAYHLKDLSGNRAWIAVKWHSLQLIFFYAGLAATARNDNDLLFQLFDTKIVSPASSETKTTIPQALLYVNSHDLNRAYDNLIEQTNHKVPLRQHLFNQIQKEMEEIIYLGERFEDVFYRFEIIFALDYINRNYNDISDQVWAPIGLFGFKQYGYNPFKAFVDESEQKGENWNLLQSGFFNGDLGRFKKICKAFQERFRHFIW